MLKTLALIFTLTTSIFCRADDADNLLAQMQKSMKTKAHFQVCGKAVEKPAAGPYRGPSRWLRGGIVNASVASNMKYAQHINRYVKEYELTAANDDAQREISGMILGRTYCVEKWLDFEKLERSFYLAKIVNNIQGPF